MRVWVRGVLVLVVLMQVAVRSVQAQEEAVFTPQVVQLLKARGVKSIKSYMQDVDYTSPFPAYKFADTGTRLLTIDVRYKTMTEISVTREATPYQLAINEIGLSRYSRFDPDNSRTSTTTKAEPEKRPWIYNNTYTFLADGNFIAHLSHPEIINPSMETPPSKNRKLYDDRFATMQRDSIKTEYLAERRVIELATNGKDTTYHKLFQYDSLGRTLINHDYYHAPASSNGSSDLSRIGATGSCETHYYYFDDAKMNGLPSYIECYLFDSLLPTCVIRFEYTFNEEEHITK